MPQVTKAKPAPFFGPKQHGTMPFLGVKREPQARRGPESASVRPSFCSFVCPFVRLSVRQSGTSFFVRSSFSSCRLVVSFFRAQTERTPVRFVGGPNV